VKGFEDKNRSPVTDRYGGKERITAEEDVIKTGMWLS